jgi:hypothetical protein
MLHRRTFDKLTEGDAKVLSWKVTTEGGLIATQDEPSVFSVWVEGWDESLKRLTTYDTYNGMGTVGIHNFSEAKVFGEMILSQIEVPSTL